MRTDAVGELEPILDVASRKQPEQYANARKLAGEMHLPMDVVERNHDQVLSEQTKRTNMQLLGMAPGTAEYMRRNPEVVPAVTDMVEEMGLFERTLASIPNAIGAGVAQQRISELQREDMRGRATPGSLAELRALQKQEAARPDYGLDPVQAAVEGRYGEAALASIPTTLQEIPELWEEIKYRVGFGVGGAAVGAGVGALGANPVTIGGGAATGFVTSQNIGGFVAMREQTIGPLYAYYRNLDDVDEGEARALAEVASTFSGVLNSLPTSALLRRTPVLGGFFQRLTTDALREVLAQRTFRSATKHILGAYAEGFALEGLAEAGDQLNQYMWQALNNVREGREAFEGIRVEVPQPDGSVAILEGLEGIVADMMMAGFQGALAGGGMSGTFEATSATIDLARQDRTDHRLAIAARALQQAQGSALRERDPQTFRDHVQSLVDQGMLEENVEVTREALREFFQSADEAEVEAAWENIAALQEQDGVAYETGADFQIPVADFLTYLAGSAQTPELAQHVRWNEKDFTAAEMADLEGTEELAQRVVASVAQRLDEVTEGDEVLEAFREQRLEQLLKVHPPGIAQSLADYATAVMAVRQQRLNMPLIDILDREAELQIVPPGDPRDQPYDGPTLEQRLERRRLESFVSDMRAGRDRLADQAPLRPILSHLRDLGGIDPDSPLAGDLRSMGVAARGKGSFPGLYRTGGMADLGEIDMAEHAWLGAYFDVDDVGSEADQVEPGVLESRRASPEQIMAAIESELRGEALRPPELEEMIGEVEAERGRIRDAIEEAGLSLEDSPMDEILDALQTQEEPPMPEGMPAPGETFYEGGLLPPGLKSVLLEVATTLPKKAPIGDYRSALEKQVEKGNVKADELEFSGLLEYMEMAEERGDELTRRDIVQFLQEGGLQVKVNLLGGESSEATNLTSRYAADILSDIDPHTVSGGYVRNLSELSLLQEDLPPSPLRDRALIVHADSVDELAGSDSEQVWTTALPRYDVPDLQVELQNILIDNDLNLSILKYPDLVGRRRAELVQQYPNGRKYIDPGIARDNDELLILMMLAQTNFADEYFAALDAEPPPTQAEKLDGAPEFGQYILEAGSEYMEILVTLPKRADETRQPFTAGHWGSEPEDVVVSLLAEARDGKLFIFEMQSDWHQRGRKYGYATAASQKNEAELHDQKAALLSLRADHIARIHAEMDRHLSAVGLSVESSDELDIRRRLREEGGSIKIPLQPVRDGGTFDPDGDYLVLVQLGEEGKDGFGFGAHIETDGPDGSTTTRLPFDFAHAHRAVRAARHHLALEDSKTKELIAKHDEVQDRLSNLREMVPAAPFSKTQSWTDLGLKNALLQAYAMDLSGIVMTDADLVFNRWGDEGVKSYYTKTVPKRMRALAQKYGGEVEPLQEWDGVPAMGAINFTPELADAIESDSIELFQAVATDFAGIGTVDAMLPEHPSVHAAELQPDIVSAYNDAHGTNYRARDVLQVDPRELEDADLYHASPVCTNLSAARKGRGVSDLDEASARKVAANILATRPPAVTIENVPLYADTVLLEIITAALDEEGYTYDVATYDAADYGGAQTRKRMILRAVREGELPPLPEKSEPGDWFDSVRDLIDEAEDAQIPNWERTRLDAMIERGEIDPELPIITMGGSTDKRRANAKNAGGPSPTLTATPKSVPRIIMPDGTVKKVSPRMMARLMGLPDTFRIPEENWALSKTVMGNGVHGAITTAIIGPVADLGEQIAQRGQMELFQGAAPTDDGVSPKVAATPGIQNALPYLTAEEQRKLKANTAQRLVELIAELPEPSEVASVAFAGRAKRGWYLESAKAILDVFGLEDSRRFTALLAALSPQTSVESNLVNALAVWNAWVRAGRPTDESQILALMGEAVQGDKGEESVLDAWRNNSFRALTAENPTTVILSGPKVNSFMLNLRGVVDEVTNDTWMANVFGVMQTMFAGAKTKTDPGKGPGYMAANVVTRRAAEILSQRTGLDWTPAEIQETIWSWAKTLGEMGEAKGETRSFVQILTDGELTDDRIADTPDFAILFSQGVYRALLEEGGYGEELQSLGDAARDDRSDGAGEGDQAGQAPGIAESRYRGDLRRAARRLERTRAERGEGNREAKQRRKAAESKQFEQPSEGESPRGSIRLTRDLSQQTIVWSNQADLSTFLHENAHLWLEMLQADAEVEGGDPTLAQDLATLRSFLGVPESARIEGEAHEKFARLVELYIMDGQAPTAEMAVMFQRFSRWLLDIYNSLRKRMGYFGELELSDEVRGVLDRMHATQAQIDQAREQRGLDLALFDSDTQAEMDREAWIKYQQALDSSRRGAQHAFHKRVVSRIKRQLSEDYRARRASVRDEVEAELAEDPLWKARTWLQRGEMPGERPESLPEERDGLKLDRDDLVRLFGKEILKELPFGRYGVWQRDGMPVELVVAHFGLESEDQLVRFLADSRKQSLKKEIEERTDRLMDERFGELNNSDELEDATVEALASDPALKALILEEQALARQAGGRPRPATIMRQQIQAMVGGMQYLQLQPARFQRAAAKAAREAVAAVAAGDAEAAREAKQRQIAAVMMERAQRQAIRRSEAHRKALAKIAQPSNATHRKLGRAGYWDQVATLLEGIELKASVSRREIEKRESLLTWIAAREAEDGSTEGIPDWLRERANLRSWKLLTVDELQGVRDAVDNIVALARLKVDLQVAGEKRAMDDVAEELAQAAEENVNARTRETPPGTQGSGVKARLERSQQTLLSAEASLLKIENILDRLDGFMDGGPWRQAIWLPLKKAREERAQRWDEFSRRYAELVENVSKGREKEMLEKRHYRELERSGPSGTDGIYNKWSLIMMLLNLGNDSNKKKLLEGYGWSEPVILSILSEQLDDRDLDFVEAVWELVNELWPEIRDQQIRLEGVAPPKVEGREVQIGNRKLRGQYFPVVYDLSRSQRQQELGELGAIFTKAQNSFMRPLTGHGHTKARVKVAYPIKLETNVIASHMDQVILDLTHRETLLQIDRLLRHSKVRDAVEATLGEDQYKLFRPWLQRIAADAPTEATSVKGIDRVLRAIRVHGTTMALGFRATTLAMQASGNFNGISFLKDRVGPGWMRHYMEALKTSGLGLVGKRRAELRDAVFADSAFMRGRIDSIDRDMRTIQREAESALPGERYFQAEGKLRAKAMALIGVVQLYSVDIPIWNAAYNAGMLDLGMTHEAAVDFADQAVSQTQGSGGVMDQSQLQSAAEAYKMLTTFFSYHNTLYQKLREAGVRAVERKEYMRLLSEAVLLLVLPFVWAQLARAAIRELTDGDGEEYLPEELADVPMWLLAGTVVEGVSTIPGIREGAPLISKWLADGHYFESRVPFQRLIGDVQDLGDVKSDTDLAADLVRLIAGWGRGLPIDQSVDLLEKALED